MVPTSLLACMTLTIATSSGSRSMAARTVQRGRVAKQRELSRHDLERLGHHRRGRRVIQICRHTGRWHWTALRGVVVMSHDRPSLFVQEREFGRLWSAKLTLLLVTYFRFSISSRSWGTTLNRS